MTQFDAVQLPIFSTFYYDIADNFSMKKSTTDCTRLLRALLLFASIWFYVPRIHNNSLFFLPFVSLLLGLFKETPLF